MKLNGNSVKAGLMLAGMVTLFLVLIFCVVPLFR